MGDGQDDRVPEPEQETSEAPTVRRPAPSEPALEATPLRDWSRPPEDLTGEKVLRHCPRHLFEGQERPTMGPCTLLSKLGQGGMGVVYHGVHNRLNSEVAVKVLPLALHSRDDALVDRFEREAQLAARLKSNHLVSVLDIDEDESSGCHFIVMEYVKGVGADRWLRAVEKETGSPPPECDALDVCIAATRGLVSAHVEGVVHRDIKPANILIPRGPDGTLALARAKLADLGLARSTGADLSLTGSKLAMGTPGYMAPEQASDAKTAKKPADVFGMGATLYSLLTGGAPFAGSSPADALVKCALGEYRDLGLARPDVSPGTADVVSTCLASSPAARFKDASALLDALETARTLFMEGTEGKTVSANWVTGLVGQAEAGLPVPTATPTGKQAPESATAPVPSEPPAPPVTPAGRNWKIPAAVVAVLMLVALVVWRPWRPKRPGGRRPGGALNKGDRKGAGKQGSGKKRRNTPPPVAAVRPGLDVRSTPAGATVLVDGEQRGITPCTVDDLSVGFHAVRIELAGHEAFESTAVEITPDARVPLAPDLARSKGRVAIRGGVSGARVMLRHDERPESHTLMLDERGELGARELGTGRYSVVITADGHAAHEGAVVVERGGLATLTVRMPSLDGVVALLESTPSGATVSLGKRVLGTTPLRDATLAPGAHELTITLAEHVEQRIPCRIAPGVQLTLPSVTLVPWGTLDLSAAGTGVEASLGGVTVTRGTRVAPGPRELLLRRAGHADRRVPVDVAPGKPYVVPAQDWSPLRVPIDLRKLPPRVTLTLDGKALRHGDELAPGDYSVQAAKPGHRSQSVRITVRPDGSVAAPQVTFKPVRAAGPSLVEMLVDLKKWDAATSGRRLEAAQRVAGRLADFHIGNLETFSSGGASHEIAILIHTPTGTEFSLIPAGRFRMGSQKTESGRSGDEGPVDVRLTRPFLIARREVSQRVWKASYGALPFHLDAGDARPVNQVSWHDARAFCTHHGLTLPTEAQWEWAARGGTTSPYSFGDDAGPLKQHAWTKTTSGGRPRRTGQLQPNAFGLFDMHGNVYEWCSDWYGPYSSGSATDPTGPSVGDRRVLRGGGYDGIARFQRSAFRSRRAPTDPTRNSGLRPALELTRE